MSIYSVLFGNNYPGTANGLDGCITDLNYYKTVSDKFNANKIETVTNKDCTKATLLSTMRDMLKLAKRGERVLITYSGHGTKVPPGVQAWVPYDFDWDDSDTWLTYDELDRLFLKYEAEGVQVVVISDSCHSQADPRLHFRDLKKKAQAKNKFIAPPDYVSRKIISDPFNRNVLSADQDDILLAGCQKNQTSADALINDAYHGAFSYALELGLKDFMSGKVKAPPSYQKLVMQARAWLAQNDYDQVPSANGDPKLLQAPFLGEMSVRKRK